MKGAALKGAALRCGDIGWLGLVVAGGLLQRSEIECCAAGCGLWELFGSGQSSVDWNGHWTDCGLDRTSRNGGLSFLAARTAVQMAMTG